MSDMNREFLVERDSQIFNLRKTGMPVTDIAKRYNLSTSAANAAIRRQLEKMNREALNAYPEVLRLELERLDAMQRSIWPLTQHRMIQMPDGTEIRVEPDLKAVAEVRAIMNSRAKLLGLEQTNIRIDIAEEAPARATLHGAERVESIKYDPEAEARRMLELMLASGVIDRSTLMSMGELGPGPIEDAVIIESEEVEVLA